MPLSAEHVPSLKLCLLGPLCLHIKDFRFSSPLKENTTKLPYKLCFFTFLGLSKDKVFCFSLTEDPTEMGIFRKGLLLGLEKWLSSYEDIAVWYLAPMSGWITTSLTPAPGGLGIFGLQGICMKAHMIQPPDT